MDYTTIIGEIVAVIIAVGLPILLNHIFKWSKRYGISIAKEQEEYIMNATTNGVLEVWNTYTKEIKKHSIDGKLTDAEKKEARNKAIEISKSIIVDEFKKAYKRGDIDKLIEGSLESIYSTVKEKLPKINANEEIIEAMNIALKIVEKRYISEFKKSAEEGKFPEEYEVMLEAIYQVVKLFVTKETADRIDDNGKDEIKKLILREIYKVLFNEKKPDM